ncbi:MAG: endonuclease/exonuclease/phosphatase family protein [Candidatus Pacebacteria bacterium]|nr:endonuclease/exonuclease/phosphatase family protein [Candidatus Paceibacterota bacterium]
MRFLVYNIAYGTGAPRSYAHRALTLHRYLSSTRHHIERLHAFILQLQPDVVGLVELDTGSFRTGGRNHALDIARILAHDYTYSSKYQRGSMGRLLPVLRHQGNALFANEELTSCEQHFLPAGFKRLVLDARVYGTRILLVHLALNRHTRRKQLEYLGNIVGKSSEPVILAGDFNAFKGAHELEELMHVTGLRTANRNREPTYPAWQPRKELDFILCSDTIQLRNFEVLDSVRLSDHLPLLMDCTVTRPTSTAKTEPPYYGQTERVCRQ